jgi:hypothetical protein
MESSTGRPRVGAIEPAIMRRVHAYQDLVIAGGAFTVVCVAAFVLLRRGWPSTSRAWQAVTVVGGLIGAFSALFGFLHD